MDKQTDLLVLSLRWLAHDLANPLSALRSGMEIGADDLAQQGSDHLVSLVRLVQQMGMLGMGEGGSDNSPPKHFGESLTLIAQARNVELEMHLEGISLAQSSVLAALFLAIIPLMVSGNITLTAECTKLMLEARGLGQKAQSALEEGLKKEAPILPAQIPLYLAKAHARDIQTKHEDDCFKIEVLF